MQSGSHRQPARRYACRQRAAVLLSSPWNRPANWSSAPFTRPLASDVRSGYLTDMDVQLSPEQQERLEKLAADRGADTSTVLSQMVAHALEYEEWFIREVEKGRASLRRGEFVDHDELKARIAKRLQRT